MGTFSRQHPFLGNKRGRQQEQFLQRDQILGSYSCGSIKRSKLIVQALQLANIFPRLLAYITSKLCDIQQCKGHRKKKIPLLRVCYLLHSLLEDRIPSGLTDNQVCPLYHHNADKECCVASEFYNFPLLISLKKIKRKIIGYWASSILPMKQRFNGHGV